MAHPTSPWAAVAIGGARVSDIRRRRGRSRRRFFRSRISGAIADVDVVDDVSIGVQQGSILAIVGESGCGQKPDGLVDSAAAAEGRADRRRQRSSLEGTQPDALSRAALAGCPRQRCRSIIFQEPIASLNPLMRVGAQVEEALTPASRHLARRPHAARPLRCWRRSAFPMRRGGPGSFRSSCPVACASAS